MSDELYRKEVSKRLDSLETKVNRLSQENENFHDILDVRCPFCFSYTVELNGKKDGMYCNTCKKDVDFTDLHNIMYKRITTNEEHIAEIFKDIKNINEKLKNIQLDVERENLFIYVEDKKKIEDEIIDSPYIRKLQSAKMKLITQFDLYCKDPDKYGNVKFNLLLNTVFTKLMPSIQEMFEGVSVKRKPVSMYEKVLLEKLKKWELFEYFEKHYSKNTDIITFLGNFLSYDIVWNDKHSSEIVLSMFKEISNFKKVLEDKLRM